MVRKFVFFKNFFFFQDLQEITDILLEEEMKVEIECEVDFNPKEITRALKYILSRKSKGKLVVKID